MAEYKNSNIIKTSFRGTSHEFSFDIPLRTKNRFYLNLHSLSTFNSIPNVEENQYAEITFTNDIVERIQVPMGAYEITDLNALIRHINIEAITTVLKLKITYDEEKIKNIYFTDGLKNLLGLEVPNVHYSPYYAPGIVDISSMNSINVEVNIIENSYENGISKPIIYSFNPNAQYGFRIIENVRNPIFLPVTSREISNIKIRLIDQDGKLINNRNERVDILFHLKEDI